MKELKPRIHENGIDYILVGDYYVPDWKLPEEKRPVGHGLLAGVLAFRYAYHLRYLLLRIPPLAADS